MSLVFSAGWNPEEAGSDASEGKGLSARREWAGNKPKLPPSRRCGPDQRRVVPPQRPGLQRISPLHVKQKPLTGVARFDS